VDALRETPPARIYDNGGTTFDRYAAVFPDGDVLVIGPTGNHPQGACLWLGPGTREDTFGAPIELEQLPQRVQRAIRAEWDEWYATDTGGARDATQDQRRVHRGHPG